MKHIFTFIFLLASSSFFLAQAQTPVTFAYNGTNGADGSAQTYAVPTGIYNLSVVAFGAAGADGSSYHGGKGGQVEAILKVTPGQVLTIYVGGSPPANAKGYNGGGTGCRSGRGRWRCNRHSSERYYPE